MEITDVRVRLVSDSTDRLKAFCSVTLDDEFVIRDLKVVDGATGLFVAMPSRKATFACPKCRHKNAIKSRHCNDCGAQLPAEQPAPQENGRSKTHRDIAHPITTAFRERIQTRVINAYKDECHLADDPNYEPQQLDVEEELHEPIAEIVEEPRPVRATRAVREEPESDVVDFVSDYDALIANLKGGGSGAPRGRSPAPPVENRAQPSNRRPAPPPPRPRQEEPRSRQEDTQARPPRGPRGGRDQGRDRGPRPEPAPPPRAQEPKPVREVVAEKPQVAATEPVPFGVIEPLPRPTPARTDDRPVKRVTTPVSAPSASVAKPEPVREPASAAVEDVPFGAGVL